MAHVRIVTDSVAYLPRDVVERRGIRVASLSVVEDGRSEREMDMDWPAFYRRLDRMPALPTSSQPPPAEFVEIFAAAVEAGEEVCGVFLSTGMSGTFASATTARELVVADHPDAVIELVDSRFLAMMLGFIVLAAAETAEAGGDAGACAAAARDMTHRGRWLVMPTGLENLRKGGRMGGASAMVGSALQILPLLTVRKGRVELLRRVRTRRRLLAEAVAFFAEETERLGLVECCVQHIELPGEAEDLADMVEKVVGYRPRIYPVGPVVGLHVGPGTGIAYVTREPIAGAA